MFAAVRIGHAVLVLWNGTIDPSYAARFMAGKIPIRSDPVRVNPLDVS